MSRVTFQAPVANISGRLSYQSNIVLRTRNGRTQAYIIQNPYKGPVAPQRQRTINAFKEAVNQSKIVLSDPVQRAEYESKYKAHKAFFRRHPRSQNKYYSTLRGFVIAQLAQQINAAAKAAAAAKEAQNNAEGFGNQAVGTTTVSASVAGAKGTVDALSALRSIGVTVEGVITNTRCAPE